MRASLFITCNTHHSLTQVWCISEEGNTLGLDKKKTTVVGSASYYFGAFTVLVLILSLRKLQGFSIYGFLEDKHCVHCLLCLIAMLVILSVNILI